MEDLVIDTGLSAEEVRKYVSVGDIVTFKVEPLVLQNNRFSSSLWTTGRELLLCWT